VMPVDYRRALQVMAAQQAELLTNEEGRNHG